MNKLILAALTSLSLCAVFSTGCDAFTVCGPDQVDCGGGFCAPSGATCCSETTYCNAGETCGPNNTCLSGSVGGCLASGEQTCYNTDGSTDCAPLLATCCGDHTYCAYPYPVCDGTRCLQ